MLFFSDISYRSCFKTPLIRIKQMARVTVEDCAEVVHSRFELVAIAAQRARAITAGGQITVERNNDKNAVVALREIAGETINIDAIREDLIRSCQEKVNVDEYGVEEISEDAAKSDTMAEEALAELKELQPKVAISSDSDDDIYGLDDVESED